MHVSTAYCWKMLKLLLRVWAALCLRTITLGLCFKLGNQIPSHCMFVTITLNHVGSDGSCRTSPFKLENICRPLHEVCSIGLPVHLWILFLVSYIQRTASAKTMFEYQRSTWQILLSKVTKNTIITVSYSTDSRLLWSHQVSVNIYLWITCKLVPPTGGTK